MLPQNLPANTKYVDSENKFSVYCNFTGIAMTAFDIRLLCGQIEPSQGPIVDGEIPGMTVVHQGSIIMSPLHAKLVCENLQANIENYEKMFGKIEIPLALQTPTPVKG